VITFEELIQDLKSTDPAIRDKAALDLMDIGDDRAMAPIIDAIRVPENVNYRGTLVYALSDYDCIEHLEYLVELCLTSNFEVSSCSFNIIEGFELTKAIIKRIKSEMLKYNENELRYEHSMDARNALSNFISTNRV